MGNRRKKKCEPSPIVFKRHRGNVWCVVGPADLMKEGALVYVSKANGRHDRVRIVEILATENGITSALFERKEKKQTYRGRGNSR